MGVLIDKGSETTSPKSPHPDYNPSLIFPFIALAGRFKVIRVYDAIMSKQSGMTLRLRSALSALTFLKLKKTKESLGSHTAKKTTKFIVKLVLNKTVEVLKWHPCSFGYTV